MSTANSDAPGDGFVRHTIAESDFEDSAGVVEEVKTEPFRPRRRSPMAILTVHADGGEEEWSFPVFRSPYVIGRSEGDFLIEHDLAMSKRHAALVRRPGRAGGETWYLEDVGSRNGLYVRAVRAVLGHGEEILLGAKRFRVVDKQGFANRGTIADTDEVEAPEGATATDTFAFEPTREPQVHLVEVIDSKPQGQAFKLEQANQWLGRNERLCSLVLDDPMISPRHALLRPAKDGKWTIADARSVNGVWVRVKAIPLSDSQPCQFQVGEQRFTVRIP